MEQELSIEREENKPIYNNRKQSSSLRELCSLLISSFCSILEEFGLETQADEELLLLAMDSNDLDTVCEYVKLLRNKLSSILLLKNIKRENSFESINQSEIHDYIEYMNNNNDLNNNNNEKTILIDDDQNNKLTNPLNNIKKSPVPPLKVEFAGPGSWNRCQLPNEYPRD